MNNIFEYLPEVITALWGLFTGILLEKVNANKDKRIEIFQLRKEMYIEIIKIISNIPSSSCNIDIYKKYYKDLLD